MDEALTREAPAARAGGETGAAAPALSLPRVCVVIVNYNYGRFLEACVGSALAQTYPDVECVVVDNASTDETPQVLARIEAGRRGVKIIRRAANDGQTPAALDGLRASDAPYVIFVDADDLLLPHCVATHVFVHLSLRVHVGFSSGDMLQASGREVVLGSEEAFGRIVTGRRGREPQRLRAYRQRSGAMFSQDWPGEDVDRSILARLRFVEPMTNEWVWSPTSGNCFRRDALELFLDQPALETLRTGTDLYFCLGVNAVCGSVLIDDALAVYRLHGGNVFSKRPQLRNVLSYQPGGSGDSNDRAKAILIDHLIDHARFFVERGWTPFDFARLLRRMDCSDPDATAATPRWSARSRVATRLLARYPAAAAALGEPIARGLLFVSGAPLSKALRPRA